MTELLIEFGRWITNPRYFVLEILVLLLALVAGAAAPWLGAGWFHRVGRGFAALAGSRARACIAAAILPVALRLMLLPALPPPTPEIHDEFSLLLGADTFARGRVVNATHAMWRHFESFHVLHEPGYMTMYPPGQSLLLALGLLVGHPWIGVLLSTALMCGALTWALRAWLPPRWALLGGLLAGARYGAFSYWTDSYWGGQLAAAGGALVVGAVGRLLRRRSIAVVDGAALALGAAMLAYRRPFEGLVLCAAAGLLLLFRLRGRLLAGKPGAAAIAILFPAIIWLGYYNWRVTGDPVTMPQSLAAERYLQISYWVLLPRPADGKAYNHEAMREGYAWEVAQYEARRDRWLATTKDHFVTLWRFYAGPCLTVGLIGALWVVRNRRMRPLLWLGAAGAAAMSVEVWMFPHYAAPWTAVAMALMMQGLRQVRYGWRAHGAGALRAVCVTAAAMALVPAACVALGLQWPSTMNGWWVIKDPWPRHAVAAKLGSIEGRHLALVRYEPGHDLLREWVYNGADIDGQKVVWARAMTPEEDARLMEYYGDRTVWLLTDDGREPRLERVREPLISRNWGRRGSTASDP